MMIQRVRNQKSITGSALNVTTAGIVKLNLKNALNAAMKELLYLKLNSITFSIIMLQKFLKGSIRAL